MNPISVALKGKGLAKLVKRAGSLVRSYGLTPAKLDGALRQFAAILHRFECRATFPITAVALGRNAQVIIPYQEQGIEFAIHGYRHVDYCQLGHEDQQAHLALAKALFSEVGVRAHGFRGPYLHANEDTMLALQDHGLGYDSSQGLSWSVLEGAETPAYRYVLGFYGALSADDYPSLPSLEGNLVHIPYSLPDDEALAHRLSLETAEQMNALWLAVLRHSYELGELFTVGLHPERTFLCQAPLSAVLSEARRLDPPVWIAPLNEIAAWWRARKDTQVDVADVAENTFQITISGPDGVTALARGVDVEAPITAWANDYHRVHSPTFTVTAPVRPVIGISPAASPALYSFVQEQGYIVEIGEQRGRYACYLDQGEFAKQDQRSLLTHLDRIDAPLVRLGRWPDGAYSALSITGDIDALTLWDYGLRLFEK